MEVLINNRTLRLIEGDITEQNTDAIVNAANRHLQLGSGVAGAIRRKGGSSIQRECNAIGSCPVGGAAITGGGDLPARYVIHAVGPFGDDPAADSLLQSAMLSSLRVADENGLTSITFPAISTGVFGFPMDSAAEIMLSTIIEYLEKEEAGLELVVCCLYGQEAFDTFASELLKQIDKHEL